MLVDTLKAKRRLVEDFHFSDEHAEGIIEVFSSAEDKVATKEDLVRLEERLRRDLTIRLYGAIATATGILLAAQYLG